VNVLSDPGKGESNPRKRESSPISAEIHEDLRVAILQHVDISPAGLTGAACATSTCRTGAPGPRLPENVEVLSMRPWTTNDTDAALAIFGRREVARWLTPAMPRPADRAAMQQLLSRWITEHDEVGRPLGHWAIEIRDSGLVIGGVALLPLPPGCTDLEIGWQITPAVWGHGYGAEAGHAVAHRAFANGVSEVFAVVRPGNTRGVATARRVGMEWSARPTSTTASHCRSTG
jgi:RimJ/RimL family protein N-acetyltransferase